MTAAVASYLIFLTTTQAGSIQVNPLVDIRKRSFGAGAQFVVEVENQSLPLVRAGQALAETLATLTNQRGSVEVTRPILSHQNVQALKGMGFRPSCTNRVWVWTVDA